MQAPQREPSSGRGNQKAGTDGSNPVPSTGESATNREPACVRRPSAVQCSQFASATSVAAPLGIGLEQRHIVAAQLRSRLATKQSLNGQAEFGLASRRFLE